MPRRLSLAVAIGCALLLVTVGWRVGDRDTVLSVLCFSVAGLVFIAGYLVFRNRAAPDDDTRKQLANLQERISVVEGKLDVLLRLMKTAPVPENSEGRE